MIGWRRRGEPSNPRKLAKREARIIHAVQSSLTRAGVREHTIGGGTLLTESVLVFHGKHGHDLSVFDQNSNQLGVARWSPDKAAKLFGYGIYGAGDELPLVVVNWRAGGWFSGKGDYTVSDSERIEIATLSPRFSDTSALSIMAGVERIGYLSPAGRSKPGHIKDSESREVARLKHMGPTLCCVAEIAPSVAGPLRTVAIVASILCIKKVAQESSRQ
jgi:hypothetical protein